MEILKGIIYWTGKKNSCIKGKNEFKRLKKSLCIYNGEF